MKNLSVSLLCLMVVFVSPIANAQQQEGCGSKVPEHYFNSSRTMLPEQLTLLVSNELLMTIECGEILDVPSGSFVDSIIHVIIGHIDNIRDSIGRFTPPLVVTLKPIDAGMLRITTSANTALLAEFVDIPSDGTLATTHFNYTIEYLINDRNVLVIYTNRLSALEQIAAVDAGRLVDSARADIAARDIARFIAKKVTYSVVQGELDVKNAFVHQKADRRISITMATGFGHLNNAFVPSVSFPVTYVQSRKSGGSLQCGISFDLLLNVDPDQSFHLRKNWYGDLHVTFSELNATLFAGYLLHRDGNLLPPNACRVGISIPVTKSGQISLRTAYHVSATHRGQNLFETGIRLGR